MAEQVPLINGDAYAWADIELNLLVRTIEGITAISYAAPQDKQNNYGRGREPVSRAQGQKKPEASITLSLKEVQAIQNALPPGKTLTDIARFPIVVNYLNENNQVIVNVLHNAEFTTNMRDVATGDMEINVELPLIISHITW